MQGVPPGAITALLAELATTGGGDTGWHRRLRPGATIGRFELVREIGRGGFGVVYEARDTELGRTVAFKAVAAGPRAALREERLLREAEAAARLAHPNIVTLYDVGRSEDGPYLVLELLRGQTLAQRLDLGPVSIAEALRIAAQVATGLAHAHAHGVVHRDLTPSNVFLCQDGQVKLLDLGLAHAFGRRKLDGGTASYMAPEQRRGAPEDERTDVFALGVIVHRMLAGELPFADGREPTRALAEAPSLDVHEVPALGPFVARMLSPDPVQRPRDGDEVARALDAFRQELASAASDRSPVVKVRPKGLGAAIASVARRLGLHRTRSAPERAPERTPSTAPTAETPSTPPPPSVAVLPFADLSPSRDQDWLCDGIAEEILHALAGLAGLRVASRSASFQFKGRTVDGREMARALGVTTLLEGGVRKAGDRVRITARLIDADGYEVWSESFDRVLQDVFAIQDEIAHAVVKALQVRLSSGETHRLQRTGTRNPRAYELYLRARQLHAWSKDRPRIARARHLLQGAVELDATFAEAQAALAVTDCLLLRWNIVEGDTAAVRAEALAASEKALAIDPDLADAHVARANLLSLDGRSLEAEQGFQRAVALNPGLVEAWYGHARFLFEWGKLEESARAFEEAARLDPDDYDALSLLPQVYRSLGDAAREASAIRRARDAVERYLRVTPDDVRALYMAGNLAIRSGDKARGMALLARTLEIQPDEFSALYNCACGYALAGDVELALDLLDRCVAKDRGQRKWIEHDSDLDVLRSHPRYAQIVARLPR